MKVYGKKVFCIVCTCAHAFLNIFGNESLFDKMIFTFSDKEIEINQDLSDTGNGYRAYPVFCPATVDAVDGEVDPMSGRMFSLPHDIALVLVLERDNFADQKGINVANPFQVTFQHPSGEENIEANLIGYPTVTEASVKSSVLPDIDELGISYEDLRAAFYRPKALVASPGKIIKQSREMIAITNPAAPRLSGSPLIINGEVAGILVGSIPMERHIQSVKIALTARQSLQRAINYIRENSLTDYLILLNLESEAEESKSILKDALISRCKKLNENGYEGYFENNPKAPRYNLALATSSNYFKAAYLLTKHLENLDGEFKNMGNLLRHLKEENFLNFNLQKSSSFTSFLTVTLDDSFDQVFTEKIECYKNEHIDYYHSGYDIIGLELRDNILYHNFDSHSPDEITVREAVINSQLPVAVKLYTENFADHQLEIDTLSTLSGRKSCFLDFYGSMQRDGCLYIVTELCNKSLYQDINERKGKSNPYTYEERKNIIEALLEGFALMHTLNIYHKDIKPENIMFTAEKTVKIIDFNGRNRFEDSKAIEITTGEYFIQGSINWISPEFYNCRFPPLNSEDKNKSPLSPSKCDVFSLGLVFLNLFTFDPIADLNKKMNNEALQKLVSEVVSPPYLKFVISQMLIVDPDVRPMLEDIYSQFMSFASRDF